jgi:LmbE family N-acetylglucosaminyl deacetylase
MFDIASLGTILGVWAHPDDETYLSAGLMAAAIRGGQRVVCVTATRGEEGSWDEVRWPPGEQMGKARELELMRCMEVLGVTEHHWLDIYDGACDRVSFEDGVALVLPLLLRTQPDTVLTFGPDGMTDHADHKAVSAWATEAFARAAKPGARLYYATMTPEWRDEFRPRMQKFNVFMSDDMPPVTPRAQLAVDFALPADVLELKMKAIEQHVSQNEHMLAAFGHDFFREGHKAETYRLGAQA